MSFARLRKPFKEYLFSGCIPHLSAVRTNVTSTETHKNSLDRSRATQQARRKEKQRSQKRQDAMNGNPCNPKRKQKQPNEGIKHQRKNRERPAEEK